MRQDRGLPSVAEHPSVMVVIPRQRMDAVLAAAERESRPSSQVVGLVGGGRRVCGRRRGRRGAAFPGRGRRRRVHLLGPGLASRTPSGRHERGEEQQRAERAQERQPGAQRMRPASRGLPASAGRSCVSEPGSRSAHRGPPRSTPPETNAASGENRVAARTAPSRPTPIRTAQAVGSGTLDSCPAACRAI